MQTSQSHNNNNHVEYDSGAQLLVFPTLLLIAAALWLRRRRALQHTSNQTGVASTTVADTQNKDDDGVISSPIPTHNNLTSASSFEAQITSYINRIVTHRREGGCDVGALVKQKDRRGLSVGKAGAVVCVPSWDVLLLMRHGERLDHAVPGWLSTTGASYLSGVRGVTVSPKYFKDTRFAPTDPPLSPSGWSQALESALYIRRQRVGPLSPSSATCSPFLALDAIHTSPFQRCVETALVVWIVGYECTIPLNVNPLGLSEFLSAKVTKQLQVGKQQKVLNGRWGGGDGTSGGGHHYSLSLDTFLKPLCQWLVGAFVGAPHHHHHGGSSSSSGKQQVSFSMPLIRKHVEDVLGGRGGCGQVVRDGEGETCLMMPCTQGGVIRGGGSSLFESIGVNPSSQENKAHLHSRVKKGVFPDGVVDCAELHSMCQKATTLFTAPLLEQSKADGVRHSIYLLLPPLTAYNAASPPPTSILAVTHADVVSAALVELCADGASPTRLASGTSVPYASWTLLSRNVNVCSLSELAELPNNNARNVNPATVLPSNDDEARPVVRGLWRLGVPDAGHPSLHKHPSAHHTIPLMRYYPHATPPLPHTNHSNRSSMEVLVGGGIGTVAHLDTIVKVVVDSR